MDRKTATQAAAVFVVTLVAGLPVALDVGRWLARWPEPRSVPPVPASSGWGTADGASDATERPTDESPPARPPLVGGSPSPTASPLPIKARPVTAPPGPAGPTPPPDGDPGVPTREPTAEPPATPPITAEPQVSAPAVTP